MFPARRIEAAATRRACDQAQLQQIRFDHILNGVTRFGQASGQRLDARYRGNGYYVSDWRRHGLRAPPRGYRWQKVDNQYVLAAVATGLIASVILANN